MTIQLGTKFIEAEKLSTRETDQTILSSTLDSKVLQTLQQRVQKEAMAMVPSLAKQMAKDSWQAELEIYRIEQAQRIGSQTLASATKAISRNTSYAQRLIAAHPELGADIEQMLQEQNDLVKQLPRVATVGYMRRYYQMDAQRRDP